MSTLIALPVSGDAFLYETKNLVVLVDGGRSSRKLAAALLALRPRLRRIDVIICTHADADHSGGLKELLKLWKDPAGTWRGEVGEFWLPGRWSELARRSLTDPKALIDDFVADVDRLAASWEDQMSKNVDLDEILDPGALDESPQPDLRDLIEADQVADLDHLNQDHDDKWSSASHDEGEAEWIADLRRRLEEVLAKSDASRRAFDAARSRIRYRVGNTGLSRRFLPSPSIRLMRSTGARLLGLIDTLQAIHDVASSALTHNVRIRWFDYRAFERSGRRRGGIANELLPMNSSEQRDPLPDPIDVVYMAYLSEVNRESLVFYAPGHGTTTLGVLFSADSLLGSGRAQRTPFPAYHAMRQSRLIMTAPHHGSETNANAYGLAKRHYNPIGWLRSKSTCAVGSTFKSLSARLCTGCDDRGKPVGPAGVRLKRPFAVCGCPCDCN